MRKIVAGILRQYGSIMTISHGESTVKVRGFFQPVRSKSWQYLEGNYSPLGEIPRGQYVYIGPVEPLAEAGDTLVIDDKAYWLRRTELVRDSEGPVYCWGLCVEKGGEDHWGQS